MAPSRTRCCCCLLLPPPPQPPPPSPSFLPQSSNLKKDGAAVVGPRPFLVQRSNWVERLLQEEPRFRPSTQCLFLSLLLSPPVQTLQHSMTSSEGTATCGAPECAVLVIHSKVPLLASDAAPPPSNRPTSQFFFPSEFLHCGCRMTDRPAPLAASRDGICALCCLCDVTGMKRHFSSGPPNQSKHQSPHFFSPLSSPNLLPIVD